MAPRIPAIALAVVLMAQPAMAATPTTPGTPIERLAARFSALFPEQGAQMKALARDAWKQTGDPNAALDLVAKFMADFAGAHHDQEMAAPGEYLQRVAFAKAYILAALRKSDIPLCARAARGGFDDATLNGAAKGYEVLLIAEMEATRAGLDHPSRAPRPLSLADDERLRGETAATLKSFGWSDDEIGAVIAPLGETPPSDQATCNLAVARYTAVAGMPADEAGRFMAGLQLREGFP
jgi:hypothetical protein